MCGRPRLCSDPVLTIHAGVPWSRNRRPKDLQPYHTPKTLTANSHARSLLEESSNHVPPLTPALLKSRSTRPSSRHARSASCSTDSSFDTSQTAAIACAPPAEISSATWCARSSSMSATTTCAPFSPSASPIARPIPLAPPVTTATLSRTCIPTSASAVARSRSSDLELAPSSVQGVGESRRTHGRSTHHLQNQTRVQLVAANPRHVARRRTYRDLRRRVLVRPLLPDLRR